MKARAMKLGRETRDMNGLGTTPRYAARRRGSTGSNRVGLFAFGFFQVDGGVVDVVAGVLQDEFASVISLRCRGDVPGPF
jgi:hypothetical protein